MNMIFKKSREINLYEDEKCKLIIEPAIVTSKKGMIAFFLFQGITFLIWFINLWTKSELSFLFSILFTIAMIILGLIAWYDILRKEQKTYYFASERILQEGSLIIRIRNIRALNIFILRLSS